jgi:catechol 2,3-dioxygenase-like lactoylglutathione lyase family enzyme
MDLGNFSISLAVQDLEASRAFYEKLGFERIGGDGTGYLVMQNATATIGLFRGMFKGNIMTFNPGWDRAGNALDTFDDVRDIQRTLMDKGITPATRADETTDGPASFVIVDPDGNTILVDQHVPRP